MAVSSDQAPILSVATAPEPVRLTTKNKVMMGHQWGGRSCLSFVTCTRQCINISLFCLFELPFQRQWAIDLRFTIFVGGHSSRTNGSIKNILSPVTLGPPSSFRSDLLLCSGSPRQTNYKVKILLSEYTVSVPSLSECTRHTFSGSYALVSHHSIIQNHYVPTSFPQISPGEILELYQQPLKSGLIMLDRQSLDLFVSTNGIIAEVTRGIAAQMNSFSEIIDRRTTMYLSKQGLRRSRF